MCTAAATRGPAVQGCENPGLGGPEEPPLGDGGRRSRAAAPLQQRGRACTERRPCPDGTHVQAHVDSGRVLFSWSFAFSFVTGPAIARGASFLMARQAPSHFICGCAGRIGHLFDMAVTGDALEAMSHMPFVREVDKVRKTLETPPRYGYLLLPVIQEGGSVRCFGGQVLMATHAEVHGRDAGGGGLLGKPMAVEAVDLEAPRVQLVAEAHGLRVGAD